MGLRPSSVLTTQANASATEPTAKVLINAFGIRRPNRPFARNPSSGKIGMSQRYMMSVLHGINVVDHQGGAILKYSKNDGQSHRSFGGGDNHYEKAVDVSIHLLELIRERHEAQVHRIEHQLDGHENRDDVAAKDESSHSQSK